MRKFYFFLITFCMFWSAESQNFKFGKVSKRVQSVLDLKNTVYTPMNYEGLKQFYAMMVEKQTEAVVISKL